MATCKNCTKLLTGYQVKFCSHSCSASFSNKGVRRHGDIRFCAYCAKETHNPKFCSNVCHLNFKQAMLEKVLVETGAFPSEYVARNFLIKKFGIICWQCSLSEWRGQPIPLVLDHINGNAEDNTVANLRMLCCNCDAQTDTYKGRNAGNGRHTRRERYRQGKSF